MPASRRRCVRPAWIGLRRCGRRRSSNWLSRAGHCKPRCSIPAIWRRSPVWTFPANGWWSARTRCWPTNARASAVNCWRPPRKTWTASTSACGEKPTRCVAPPKSARRSAPSSASGRWPNTSRPISKMTASASPARPRRSPGRRSSTASTSCAPAWRPRRPTPPRRCAPTRASPGSISTRHGDSQESGVAFLVSTTGGGKRRQGGGVARIVFRLAIVAASAVTSFAEPAPALTERLGRRPFCTQL
jgi:hypothetical protein